MTRNGVANPEKQGRGTGTAGSVSHPRSGGLIRFATLLCCGASLLTPPMESPLSMRSVMASEPANTAPFSEAESRFELVELLWSVPVRMATPLDSQGHAPLPPTSPLLTNDLLLLQDRDGIRALDPFTGHPAWPAGAQDAGFLWTSSFRKPGPGEPLSGHPGAVLSGNHWIGFVDHQLVSLDLEAEGRLAWSLRLEELLGNLRARGKEASRPVASGDSILITVRNDNTRSHVLVSCTTAGQVQWRSEALECSHPHSFDVLAPGEAKSGVVYWLAGGQTLVAADIRSGKFLWKQSFPTAWDGQTEQNSLAADLQVHQQEILALVQGKLFVLDQQDGAILWGDESESPVWSLLGVHNGILAASGPARLVGIDLKTRSPRWRIDTEEPESVLPKLGLLREGYAVWPTASELWVVELDRGILLERVPLLAATGIEGGTLTLHSQLLIVVTDRECCVFRLAKRPD